MKISLYLPLGSDWSIPSSASLHYSTWLQFYSYFIPSICLQFLTQIKHMPKLNSPSGPSDLDGRSPIYFLGYISGCSDIWFTGQDIYPESSGYYWSSPAQVG